MPPTTFLEEPLKKSLEYIYIYITPQKTKMTGWKTNHLLREPKTTIDFTQIYGPSKTVKL